MEQLDRMLKNTSSMIFSCLMYFLKYKIYTKY